MRRLSYEEPGHAHELTFSCYRGLPLFNNDRFKNLFLKALDRARKKHHFEVWAYVIMPNHAHLLIHHVEPAACLSVAHFRDASLAVY